MAYGYLVDLTGCLLESERKGLSKTFTNLFADACDGPIMAEFLAAEHEAVLLNEYKANSDVAAGRAPDTVPLQMFNAAFSRACDAMLRLLPASTHAKVMFIVLSHTLVHNPADLRRP